MREDKKESKDGNNKIVLGFVGGLVMGVLVTLFFTGGMETLGKAQGSLDTLSTTTPATISLHVSVNDQKAGKTVKVLKVMVQNVSWIAVRENNNDIMGRILGARKVALGEHENISVELLRPTAKGVMYAVVLYKDDGDGEFDHTSDALIMEEGSPILDRFVAE